jgi:hypothetical protein
MSRTDYLAVLGAVLPLSCLAFSGYWLPESRTAGSRVSENRPAVANRAVSGLPQSNSFPRTFQLATLSRRRDRRMGGLGHPKRLGRFKICGAARHPYIVQAPFIEALQLVARAGTIPPFCKLPLYLVPARIAVDVNCEPPTRLGRDRQHKLALFLPLSSPGMPGSRLAYL